MKNKYSQSGFTLLEILIALFIFTIVSLILVSTLRQVITTYHTTEHHAERLRQLQLAFLLIQRDIEQTVNRPVFNATGEEEKAFEGDAHTFTFTQDGFADPLGHGQHSNLQRTQYTWQDKKIVRKTWDALDQTGSSLPHKRLLLTDITQAEVDYLDENNHFYAMWPSPDTKMVLPKAIRFHLSINKWGEVSQLYVIPVHTPASLAPPKP